MKIFTIAVVAVILMVGFAGDNAVAQEGKTYEVTMWRVPPNPEMPPVEFCTCMRFSEEAPGTLTMDHFPWALVWVHRANDPANDRWASVVGNNGRNRSKPGNHNPGFGFFTIALNGRMFLDETVISGQGVAEFGAAFMFEGFENAECSLDLCPSGP